MRLQVIAQISFQRPSFRLLNHPLCCSRCLSLAAQIETDTAVTLRIEQRSGTGTSLLHGPSSASRRSGSRTAAAGLEEVRASLLPFQSALSSREGGAFCFLGSISRTPAPPEGRTPSVSAPPTQRRSRVSAWKATGSDLGARRRALSPWDGWSLRGSPRLSADPARHSPVWEEGRGSGWVTWLLAKPLVIFLCSHQGGSGQLMRDFGFWLCQRRQPCKEQRSHLFFPTSRSSSPPLSLAIFSCSHGEFLPP